MLQQVEFGKFVVSEASKRSREIGPAKSEMRLDEVCVQLVETDLLSTENS